MHPTSIEDRQDEAHEFEDEAAEHEVELHEIPAEAKTGPSPEPEPPPPRSRRLAASAPPCRAGTRSCSAARSSPQVMPAGSDLMATTMRAQVSGESGPVATGRPGR